VGIGKIGQKRLHRSVYRVGGKSVKKRGILWSVKGQAQKKEGGDRPAESEPEASRATILNSSRIRRERGEKDGVKRGLLD